MSAPVVYTWLPVNAGGVTVPYVAPVQSASNTDRTLSLVSSVTGTSTGPYIFDKVIRGIRVLSNTDLRGCTITIDGIGALAATVQLGTLSVLPITETVPAGPNAGAYVNSTYIYSQINSITINGNIPDDTDVSVGFANFGITNYAFLDTNKAIFQGTMQVQFFGGTANPSGSTVNLLGSLTVPQNPLPFGNLESNDPIPAFTANAGKLVGDDDNLHANTLVKIFGPMAMVWAYIRQNAPSSLTETIKITVLQQGQR